MTKEELEKEAREWIIKNSKEFITNPDYSPFDYAEVIYMASAEPREKRIEELEKENAELKEKLNFSTQYYQGEKAKDLLTKAKELMNELNEGLDKLYLSGLSAKQIAFIEQLQDKAEQFISEVEK